MAADTPRTVADDAADALTALDAAARELDNWRAHLTRVVADPTPGVTMQARHSSRIVAGIVADAVARTTDANYRAQRQDDESVQLKSVS
jgi:hypothetical protein